MNQKGFTLIELVMILVLIGIIAVFAAPRMVNVTSTNAAAFVDKLRADIRYAQNLAMTRNMRYRIYFNGTGAGAPGSGYIVVNDADGDGNWGEVAEIAQDPAGGGNLIVTLGAGEYTGITVSAPPGPPVGVVEFNSLGTPTIGGGVTITVNGDATLSVTITAQTGAVN